MFEAAAQEPVSPPEDLINELGMIIQKHGINLPPAALLELASYYRDPPPWAPWK
ncbi:hypothetical protein PWKp16_00295 [Klebsiella phage PWKp16]|nr:hypothetical protein PWKp16_00295 [Klebsiella phage PWKp16]